MATPKHIGPTDPSTPCDECGGPTYTFPSGSIWCPAEDAHPGGHFVKRVAFERRPTDPADWRLAKPQRPVRTAQPRRASIPTSKPTVVPSFGGGMDDFVESER